MIRVVIAEDQTLVRESLVTLIQNDGDIEVVGQAGDGFEAVEVVKQTRPDVVLMDIRMPNCNGLEATQAIVSNPELSVVRICILTMFELDDYVFSALRAGAAGFLLKDSEPTVLKDAIRRLARGEQILAPRVLSTVINQALQPTAPEQTAVLEVITPREQEVLKLIGQGLKNAEIERALFISRGTLKSHISHLLTKLGARDRVQLVIIAHETGLV